MNKIKHSKYKNPHLIYEFLVRQITSDLLSNIPIKESKAYGIIQRNFTKGTLKEELDIYSALLSYNAKNRDNADYVIQECIAVHQKISGDSLKKRKYQVIKEIRESYDLEKLFTANVSNYKESASVYLFLESVKHNDITTKATIKEVLVENLMLIKRDAPPILISETVKGYTKEDIKIAYKLIISRYNKLFGQKLNESQCAFIQDYVCSSPENNAWFVKHINTARTQINEHIKSNSKIDTVLKMKLKECANTLNKLEVKNSYRENEYFTLLNVYQLTEDLKSYGV